MYVLYHYHHHHYHYHPIDLIPIVDHHHLVDRSSMDDDPSMDDAAVSAFSSSSSSSSSALRGHHSIILSGESGSGTYVLYVLYVHTLANIYTAVAIVIAISAHPSIHPPSLLIHLFTHPCILHPCMWSGKTECAKLLTKCLIDLQYSAGR